MLITQGISSQGLLRYLNMNEKTLGQRIRERRKQVGLSQNGLSKAAGVSGSSISLWESDHTAPRGQNLHRLAEVLQCSPTWILFGDEDKTPAPPVSLDSALDLSEDELEMLRCIAHFLNQSNKHNSANSAPALRILIACSPSY